MTESRFLKISPSDAAVRLDLIHKVHGLEQAENYFNNMSRKIKTYKVYAALLKCYVSKNCVHKAEATMQEMRNLGEPESSLPYNILIDLYTQNGEFDKIDLLMQEMEFKVIPHDKYTLRNRMSAYIAASDVSGMKKILNRMEDDPYLYIDWGAYSLAAGGYLKLGLIEEALAMLRKFEKEVDKMGPKSRKFEKEVDKMGPKSRKSALTFLLTLYSGTGYVEELYRVWNKYKPTNGMMDDLYGCMIICLTKVDDIEGAERVFEEWESRCTVYDFRAVNCILMAYCKKGLFEKAESILKKAVKGRTLYPTSLGIVANGYVHSNQLPKAVEMLKRALRMSQKGWMPNANTLAACLDYLKDQGDATGMEEIINLLKDMDVLSINTCQRLLSTCDAAGESFSRVLCQNVNGSYPDEETNKLNTDGFSSDKETNEILGTR